MIRSEPSRVRSPSAMPRATARPPRRKSRPRPSSGPPACLVGTPSTCPHRARCEADAIQLARARAGSREDFDSLYERYFARCFNTALAQLRSPQAAELCTRLALRALFGAAPAGGACVAARVLWSLRRRLPFAE
jgi:hypothetical protein